MVLFRGPGREPGGDLEAPFPEPRFQIFFAYVYEEYAFQNWVGGFGGAPKRASPEGSKKGLKRGLKRRLKMKGPGIRLVSVY